MHGEVFAIMSMVGAVTFVVYLLISSRHKERMALLEYDRDATVFRPDKAFRTSGALKFGLFLAFGGVGILLGHMATATLGLPEEVATFAFLFMAAGGGLLTYYYVAQKANGER